MVPFSQRNFIHFHDFSSIDFRIDFFIDFSYKMLPNWLQNGMGNGLADHPGGTLFVNFSEGRLLNAF